MNKEYTNTQYNEENDVSQNSDMDTHNMSNKENISQEMNDKNHAMLSQELVSHKNEKFIVIALISAITIIAMVIGVGWAVFYPRTAVALTSDKNATNKISQDVDTRADISDFSVSDPIADNNEEIIIVYGENKQQEDLSSNSNDSQNKESPVVQSQSNPIKKRELSSVSSQKNIKNKQAVSLNKAKETFVSSNKKTTASLHNVKKPAVVNKPHAVVTTAPKKQTPNVQKKTKTIYWVQVFSTNNREKANVIKKTLEQQGIALSIVTKNVNQKLYYRLRIGPYYNKSESNKFLEWVKRDYKDAYVTENYI